MNYLLLLFFILHLVILNIFFISQFLIKKYKYLFPLLCLSGVVIVQILLVQLSLMQQQIKTQKQQDLQTQKQTAPSKKIQLSENVSTTKFTDVSPEELDQLKQNLEQILELKPDHRDILFNLGIIALRQQNGNKADEYFAKSRYQDPSGALFLGQSVKSLKN